ncbi:hypothetical protein VNO77_16787 [Canavalia gladiata]|uniref:Uncharacterized protein n=1 Tax=Canavalia gladiata TaxID=3824 RepID=A0AAN9LIG2_CANGL
MRQNYEDERIIMIIKMEWVGLLLPPDPVTNSSHIKISLKLYKERKRVILGGAVLVVVGMHSKRHDNQWVT